VFSLELIHSHMTAFVAISIVVVCTDCDNASIAA